MADVAQPTRFFTDAASALGVRVGIIFNNLRLARDDRPRRVDECVNALLETLVAHAKDIGENDLLIDMVYQHISDLLELSVSKGIEALRVVCDINIGDPHTKSERCIKLLLNHVSRSSCEEDCAALLEELGGVLAENVRSAMDLVGAPFEKAVVMARGGASATEKAIGCQLLVKMISTCSSIIKRTPALLESLTTTLQPFFLFKEATRGTSMWHVHAAVALFVEMFSQGCVVVDAALLEQISTALTGYFGSVQHEAETLGLLEFLRAAAPCPPLQAVPWPLAAMSEFLVQRNWSSTTSEFRSQIALTVGATLPLFVEQQSLYALHVDFLLQCIARAEESVAASAITAIAAHLADDDAPVPNPTAVVEGVRIGICRLPYNASLFDVLRSIDTRCGDDVLRPIYSLVDHFVAANNPENFLKLGAVIELMGPRVQPSVEALRRLTIELTPEGSPTTLTRSLSLLATLGRVHQLGAVVNLMSHELVNVRRAAVSCAVLLCERIIASTAHEDAQNGNTRRLDNSVTTTVEKLLDMAVADRDAALRLDVLKRLTPIFDVYLALPDHLEALFMARHDVSTQTRREAVVILCRLRPWHPGVVHPQLLRYQEYILGEIDAKDGAFSSAIAKANMLRLIVEQKTLLLQPKAVESVALSRLSKRPFLSKRLSIALMSLIEAVLDSTGPVNHCEARRFLLPILAIVNGGISAKQRTVGLNTLCSVLRTLSPTDPSCHTEIYRTVGRILRNESEEDYQVCLAATRLLSVIGAVNPVKLRSVIRTMEADEAEEKDAVTTSLTQFKPRVRTGPNAAERYPSVVLYLLVKAFQTSTDLRQQADALSTIMTMLKDTPANSKVVLLTQFVPQLLIWLQEPEKAHLYEGILHILSEMASLLRQFKEIVPPSIGTDMLRSLQQLFTIPQASQKPLNAAVVRLLDDLARGLPAQEIQDHRWAVEFIHQRLSQDKGDLALVLQVVRSLDSFSAILQEKDLQHVFPHVLQCIEPAFATQPANRPKMREINAACFEFLNHTMMKQPVLIKDCCAEIVHTIMWYIEDSDNMDEMEMGLSTLALLVEVVKHPAQRFIKPIQRIAEQNGFAKNVFVNMLRSAAQGFLKVKVPVGKQERLSSDHPLTVVSHLPSLTKREFDHEMQVTLLLKDTDYEVISITNSGGQTWIQFRFARSNDAEGFMRQFERKAQEVHSTLRRNLGILKLEQIRTPTSGVSQEFLDRIASIPMANKRKREQSWVAWLHNTSISMLKSSPFQPLRCVSGIAAVNNELSRDIFPFSASAIINQLDNAQRQLIMKTFTMALEMSPYDIKQVLFAVAEYMESDRGAKKTVLVKSIRTVGCTVQRESAEQKFGINYDQEGRGIVVTKLAPQGPGAMANVPVGATLQAINGIKVRSVSDIPGMIKGMKRIELTLSHVVEERQLVEPKPLMDLDVLAKVAFDSQIYAKAVYFNEVLFETLFRDIAETANRKDVAVRRAVEVVERLIEFYDYLGLTMVAKGLVKTLTVKFSENIIAPEQFGFDEIGTLEKLNWWADALLRYQAKMINTDGSVDTPSFLGVLRCYDALGETVTINKLIEVHWDALDSAAQAEVAPMRAKAALTLGDWKLFDDLCTEPEYIKRFGTVEFLANLFREEQYADVLKFVQDKRSELFESFCESFSEGYARSYDALVELQHLAHFEEVVSFAMSVEERRDMLKSLWHRRITQMASRPSYVRTLTTINSLVLRPEDDLSTQVSCIRVLIKQHWGSLAEHMLGRLLGEAKDAQSLCQHDPDLIHTYLRHRHIMSNKREAIDLLAQVLKDVKVAPGDPNADAWGRCWLLLGEWTMLMSEEDGNVAVQQLIRATELAPRNHSTFHSLGILHYDLSRNMSAPQEERSAHHVAAVTALFQAVQLTSDVPNNALQDVLRILSIWFAYSTHTALNEAIRNGISILPDYVWLHVIPQLIARIGITARTARAILADLLVRVGSQYPHALIYPLTVAEKSPDAVRRVMAERVLAGIRVKNEKMVQEASLISNEMVRIAILWTEKWHSHIQQAAGKQDDLDAILRILAPLYAELDKPSTPNERNFEKAYGQTLKRARMALQNRALDQAWVLLKQVYVQLAKTLSERRLFMADVSPTLDGITKSIVAVPGTFVHGRPLITIQKFHSRVVVMPSKQKPRRFGLDASNGQKYRFLLKGHEDLRQDERVMQFIELINAIFKSEVSSSSIGLHIPQYAVIPLTDNVGIIGWVENTETIYKMLETRRQEYSVSIYEEVNLIAKKGNLRNIEEYHRLPKQQRKALLSYVMDNSPNDELRRIIWDKNDTCEQWLAYRNSYGHTLSIMSMVGYVLGLGDRHLNNLMLQEDGLVVHIDFGDCFEVAMHRSLYAEAVPFRLTRLLVAALGITGVDGVFRLTSELAMKLLRRHSENLLSILEAFIYDPLINWRLSTVAEAEKTSSRGESFERAAGTSGTQGQPPAENTVTAPLQVAEHGGTEGPPLQMSFSVAKWERHANIMGGNLVAGAGNAGVPLNMLGQVADGDVQFNVPAHTNQLTEEETRNQQGDLALARVHAKLTGLDFGAISTTSFRLQSSRRGDAGDDTVANSSWSSSSTYNDSPKDSFAGPALTTYLSGRGMGGGAENLDVPSQVDRLIQEATSLDNLVDAYITGWAPFW